MAVVLIIILLVVCCLAALLIKDIFLRNKWKHIKGEPSLPFIGHVHLLGRTSTDIYDRIVEMWRKFDMNTFRLEMGPSIFIIITSPENNELILSNNQMIDKHADYYFLEPWLGTGLLMSKGAKWHIRRKIITPAFHFKILESYVEVFQREAELLVKKLLESGENKEVDVYPYASKCSLSSMCETAMGMQVNAQEGQSNYVTAIHDICRTLHHRIFGVLKRSDIIFHLSSDGMIYRKSLRIILKETNRIIETRRKELKAEIEEVLSGSSNIETLSEDSIGAKKKLAFLDLLLLSKTPDGKLLSNEDIKEEVNTFLFEGHDTTTSTISFSLFCLSRNPEVQEKIYQEQIKITKGDLCKPVTYREIQEMKYLEMAIKESLRLYPAVPLFGRIINTEITLADGIDLPKGTLLTCAPMLMGKNPKQFPDPDRYDPERFSSDKHRNPYAYVPFSAGPRNCIGQKFAMLELKCLLSMIVRRLHILPAVGFEPALVAEITLKSANGILMRFQERKDVI